MATSLTGLPPQPYITQATMYEIRVDFSELAKRYAGRWVALDPDTYVVVTVGESAEEVLNEANRKGLDDPVITHVVENYAAFVSCLSA